MHYGQGGIREDDSAGQSVKIEKSCDDRLCNGVRKGCDNGPQRGDDCSRRVDGALQGVAGQLHGFNDDRNVERL